MAAVDHCDDSECLGYGAAFTFGCRGTSVFRLLTGASVLFFSSGLFCINMGGLDITQVCRESVIGFLQVFACVVYVCMYSMYACTCVLKSQCSSCSMYFCERVCLYAICRRS